jgi:hypothetical protein
MDAVFQIVDDNGVIDSFEFEDDAVAQFDRYTAGTDPLPDRSGDLVLQQVRVLARSH